MVHHFDHRYGDYAMRAEGSQDTQLPDVPLDRLQDANYEPLPRYWVAAEEVEAQLRRTNRAGVVERSWPHDWILGWRDICRSGDERTVIASVIPRVAVGHTTPLMMLGEQQVLRMPCLLANLSAFAFDYVARQKVGGTHLTYSYLNQLAVLPPDRYGQSEPWTGRQPVDAWITQRVLELVGTTNSMMPLLREWGIQSAFSFDPVRRFQLRCELDAAFFHLYGLTRDEVAYVMDTFPIVRRHDEAEHGDYRTRLTILDLYDAMANAGASGRPLRSRASPLPGSQDATGDTRR